MVSHKLLRFIFAFSLFAFPPLFAAGPDYLQIDYVTKFEVLDENSYKVYDIRQLQEFPTTSSPALKAIDASAAFKPGTVLFGFGLPNVYIGRVTKKNQFVKFDAKSLYRAPSEVVETDGRTQSGVFLVPKAFPPEAFEAIKQQALLNVGTRHISCAQANATILHQVGFTLGGQHRLDQYVFPSELLKDLLVEDLEYRGQKIEFDIVISSPLSFGEFVAKIKEQERLDSTLMRHLSVYLDTPEARQQRREAAVAIKTANESSVRPFVPRSEQRAYTVKVGTATALGTWFRKVWGAHVIYEVSLEGQNIQVVEDLPERLRAFPQENPSWSTWAKKHYLFNPWMVGVIRYHMASDYNVYEGLSEADFVKMIGYHSESEPNKYNFVITGDRIIIGKVLVGSKTASWVLSKHVLLANHSGNVHFAGEFWREGSDVIFINNNSGTYKPTAEMLERAVVLVRKLLPGVTVQGVLHVEE